MEMEYVHCANFFFVGLYLRKGVPFVGPILPLKVQFVPRNILLQTICPKNTPFQSIPWVSKYSRISTLLRLPLSDFKLQASHIACYLRSISHAAGSMV